MLSLQFSRLSCIWLKCVCGTLDIWGDGQYFPNFHWASNKDPKEYNSPHWKCQCIFNDRILENLSIKQDKLAGSGKIIQVLLGKVGRSIYISYSRLHDLKTCKVLKTLKTRQLVKNLVTRNKDFENRPSTGLKKRHSLFCETFRQSCSEC